MCGVYISMVSHHVKNKRISAINAVKAEYKGLAVVPVGSDDFEQWMYEIAGRWGVSVRTAKEYMMVARVELIKDGRAKELSD